MIDAYHIGHLACAGCSACPGCEESRVAVMPLSPSTGHDSLIIDSAR